MTALYPNAALFPATDVYPGHAPTIGVTDPPERRGKPGLGFDFDPKGDPFVYVAGATTFMPANAFYVDLDTEITFTAEAAFAEADENAISYIWDFGDGYKGFGEEVGHTYTFPNPSVQVVLLVIDNKGRHLRCRRQIYLPEP